ncbi:MAG TPA: hypothetical protein VFF52_31465 [Isosphaeraceae bacterium]|nr:hypothetical protein [Isosphaeraceae bacterium]
MFGTRSWWAAVLLAVLGHLVGSAAIAGDPTPDDILKSRGLTKSGMLYVLDAETSFLDKVGKLQPSYRDLKGLHDKLFAVTRNQFEYDQLNDQWTGVNQRLRDVQAEIDTHPPLTNNLLRESWQNLLAMERQLRYEYNELNTQVTLRYRKLIPDWQKEQLTKDFQKRREEFLKETRDLRAVADTVKEQYGRLSKDDAVKKALGTLRSATKARVDLGPSPEFKNKSAWLISAERGTAPENFARRPTRKPAQNDRPARGSPKSKRNDSSAPGTPAPRPE